MAVKSTSETTSGPSCDPGAFGVEAIVSVDERGQMVLPKEVRERAGIGPGDKLALIGWQKDGEICCLCMVKTQALGELVKGFLGPMMSDLAQP